MATSATLNDWLNELSASILRSNTSSAAKSKKLQDNFRRQVRRHTNGRTNQFEVAEHLDGLEEKFQILSLDNLADALHVRRNELKEFQNHWIPDILDLFLQLSGDPARSERLLELYQVPPRIGSPPPLRWKDIVADSPIDKKDRLWRVPNFRDSDDSGYEDGLSGPEASPKSSGSEDRPDKVDQSHLSSKYLSQLVLDTAVVAQYRPQSLDGFISEEEFIREALFLLRGLPTRIFEVRSDRCKIRNSIQIRSLSGDVLQGVVDRLNQLRRKLLLARKWTSQDVETVYIAAMQVGAQQLVASFDRFIDKQQEMLLNPTSSTTASLIFLVQDVEREAQELVALGEFVEVTAEGDQIECLQILYGIVQTKQLCQDQETYSVLSSMLWKSLALYLAPIIDWVSQGILEEEKGGLFITESTENANQKKLWHNTFHLKLTGEQRPAAFLASTIPTIFACGKTSAFLNALGCKREAFITREVETLRKLINSLASQPSLPVRAAFEHTWHETVSNLLKSRTLFLKEVLTNRCGLQLALDGLETVYLGLDPDILHEIEQKVFDKIDRCHDNWNDRFELTAMLEDVLARHNRQATFSSLSIHSAYTSSRTMQSRRSSVKILNALSFRYSLPWPVANIIEERAMLIYGRIALLLMQIKRAKHVVERIGYLSAMHTPLGEDCGPAEQKYAQVLSFRLLTFLNTLLSHLMMSTLESRTTAMRRAMLEAASVDDMIRVHRDYTFHLEFSCLVASKLKVLHQSLISLLDLCVRFSDLVSQSHKSSDDGEAHSFTSAKSGTRTAQLEDDSDSDDQLVDGYSSFIVLDDDSSIFKELAKVKHQFEKHLKFFVAGLKSASMVGQHVSELGLLSDRLTWNFNESTS